MALFVVAIPEYATSSPSMVIVPVTGTVNEPSYALVAMYEPSAISSFVIVTFFLLTEMLISASAAA